MSRRKHIERRRAINAEIAKKDQANRCATCKRALPPEPERWFTAIDDDPRCSEECVIVAEERAKAIVL